jgi:[ribosomal protein S5]-alanine N-acetyltransferase
MNFTLTNATLRALREGDAESLAARINNPKISRNAFLIPYPYTLDDAHARIAKCLAESDCTHFAIVDESGVIGGIGLKRAEPGFQDVQKHVAEIGYWLAEDYWGRGIATEAVVAITQWGFDALALKRIFAAVFAWNPASTRVLEKAGFQFEARERARYFREGQFIDGLLYAKVAV